MQPRTSIQCLRGQAEPIRRLASQLRFSQGVIAMAAGNVFERLTREEQERECQEALAASPSNGDNGQHDQNMPEKQARSLRSPARRQRGAA